MAVPERGMPAPLAADRFQELDVFRGIAALWVVYFHYFLRYNELYDIPEKSHLWIDTAEIDEFGLLPVYWFFVISGFVIFWTLQKSHHWQDFAVSRFSRLFPAYWAACAITFAVGLAVPLPGQSYSILQFLANLTMLHEAFGIPAIDGVYWSLQVELIFYVLMATLFATGLLTRIHMICLFWIAACLLNRSLALAGIDVWWKVQKYGLLLQGHFFIAGIMFYHIRKNERVALSYGLLALCLVSIFLTYSLWGAIVCAGVFILFDLAIRGRLAGLVNRPLLWLGAISYPLYICHQMLGYRIMQLVTGWGWPPDLVAFAPLPIVLTMAWVLHRGIEQPAMRAIRAVWKRHRTPAPAVAAGY